MTSLLPSEAKPCTLLPRLLGAISEVIRRLKNFPFSLGHS